MSRKSIVEIDHDFLARGAEESIAFLIRTLAVRPTLATSGPVKWGFGITVTTPTSEVAPVDIDSIMALVDSYASASDADKAQARAAVAAEIQMLVKSAPDEHGRDYYSEVATMCHSMEEKLQDMERRARELGALTAKDPK